MSNTHRLYNLRREGDRDIFSIKNSRAVKAENLFAHKLIFLKLLGNNLAPKSGVLIRRGDACPFAAGWPLSGYVVCQGVSIKSTCANESRIITLYH